MRLLLDETLDVRLRHQFVGHDARTVSFMGWKSKSNGELLALARDMFDAIITSDRAMVTEQTLAKHDVPVIILFAPSNDIRDHEPLVPRILETLITVRRGQIYRIEP